jgi:L-serine kinase (ADP)
MRKIKIVPINKLKFHEQTDKQNLKRIVGNIRKDGCVKDPIVIEKDNFIILDGHHRAKALDMLGYKKIPAYVVNYFNKEIEVLQRRPEIEVSKEIVVEMAMTGKVFPHKTTKHLIPNRPTNLNIALESLKDSKKTGSQNQKKYFCQSNINHIL